MPINPLIANPQNHVGNALGWIADQNLAQQRNALVADRTAQDERQFNMLRQDRQSAMTAQADEQEEARLAAFLAPGLAKGDPEAYAAFLEANDDPRIAAMYGNRPPEEAGPILAQAMASQYGFKLPESTATPQFSTQQVGGFEVLLEDGKRAGQRSLPVRAQGGAARSGGAPAAPSAQPSAAPRKPLPTPALKIIDEANQAIASTEDSRRRVADAVAILEGDKVQLGAIRNLESRGRNYAGASDDNSRAYASLKQTLEKLRNNYLLLAKGVQTEGDANRAWNSEVGESVQNDNALALQQLTKAQTMLDRAVADQQRRISTVYENYGQEAPAAGETPPSSGLVSGQTVIRNPKTGERRVWVETPNGGVWQPLK